MLYEFLILKGGVALINDMLSKEKSKERYVLISKVVSEILENLPADIYTLRIDGEIYGEESDPPENVWDWSQVEAHLKKNQEDFGY